MLCKDIWGGTCKRPVRPPEYRCGVVHANNKVWSENTRLDLPPLSTPSTEEDFDNHDDKLSLLRKVMAYGDDDLVVAIAKSALSTEKEILDLVSQSADIRVRQAAAANPAVFSNKDVALALARDKNASVRATLASNKYVNLSSEVIDLLCHDQIVVKEALASNDGIAYLKDTIDVLADDPSIRINDAVAKIGDVEHLKWMVLEVRGSDRFNHAILKRIVDKATPSLPYGVVALAMSKTKTMTHDEVMALLVRYDSPAIRASLQIVNFELDLT